MAPNTMDPDDLEYRKSVRNMSVVLAAIVITIFAAIIIPPYVNPPRENFRSSVSLASFQGFTLNLQINATSMGPRMHLGVRGWVVSTSPSINNVTAEDMWGLDSTQIWKGTCNSGWPIGIGIMHGQYSIDNYSFGTLLQLVQPKCPVSASIPAYFLFEHNSSTALVNIGGNPAFWTVNTSVSFGVSSISSEASSIALTTGVYTVLVADEWGDVLTTNFRVGA